ncbi:MAG: conjugal transfer protein [Lachnospiraceae bacterium]|nr:conjugal transfer protein [Lachnospiraceae bacterium]
MTLKLGDDVLRKNVEWILCPLSGGKTRNRIRGDTVLINYPLYCLKCGQESLIKVKDLKITIITEPDAKTQSR